MAGFNLPPGCSVSDIPGNTPEDTAFESYLKRWAAMVNAEYGVYDEWSEKWDEWASDAYDKGKLTDFQMLKAIRSNEEDAIEMMRLQK